MNTDPGRNLSREGWTPEDSPGHQCLQSIPGHKMEEYHTLKVPTATTSGGHAKTLQQWADGRQQLGWGAEEGTSLETQENNSR